MFEIIHYNLILGRINNPVRRTYAAFIIQLVRIADAETVATFLKRGQSIVDSVVDIINYSAVVKAYTKTSDEFKVIFQGFPCWNRQKLSL